MEFEYNKLRGRIKEVFDTQASFAKAIGISSVSLSTKLNNQTVFSQDEIKLACEVLNIPPELISVYFFTEKVKES